MVPARKEEVGETADFATDLFADEDLYGDDDGSYKVDKRFR